MTINLATEACTVDKVDELIDIYFYEDETYILRRNNLQIGSRRVSLDEQFHSVRVSRNFIVLY